MLAGIMSSWFYISEKLMSRVAEVLRYAPPNNGMHPTADTTALILRRRCVAAGDAGR
jgi:hypothetical protein